MDTDQLIRTLAADNAHREKPVGFVLALALLAAAPVSLLMFFAVLGVRPDVMTAMHNPFFDLKFAVTLALAISAIMVSLHLSRPEASLRGWAFLLALPVGLLAAGIAGEMMLPQRLPMMTRLVGSNSKICMTSIPLLSLPLLVAALIGLRHGAPARPAMAGAVAGLLSAGLAATLYASHCTDDSPLFVATWYTIATALVTAFGALAGSKVLRF
ncbi:NrsF family protein [Bradyrhizobium sp.]|uniref:NrsF family protein n=1 Tax=Bradyrhizobium sp. TaxID=376 RepID=UPI003C61E45E